MKQRAKDGGHFSPNRSFFPSSEDALRIFDLRILVLELVMDAGGALNMHFGFRHRVTFVVHRHALVDLVEMYAKAEEGESEIIDTTQASPSTGDILPGPLPAGAIADGAGGRRGRLWTGCGKFAVAQPCSLVSVGAGCYEVGQLGQCVDALDYYDSGAVVCTYGFGSASGGLSFRCAGF